MVQTDGEALKWVRKTRATRRQAAKLLKNYDPYAEPIVSRGYSTQRNHFYIEGLGVRATTKHIQFDNNTIVRRPYIVFFYS